MVLDKRNWNAAEHCYEVLAGGEGRAIRAWWDRHLQLWTIQRVDAAGDQLDHVDYAPNRYTAEILINQLGK